MFFIYCFIFNCNYFQLYSYYSVNTNIHISYNYKIALLLKNIIKFLYNLYKVMLTDYKFKIGYPCII